MRIVMTGVAGFIGNQVAKGLLNQRHNVVGLAGFTDYGIRVTKGDNVSLDLQRDDYSFVEADLRTPEPSALRSGSGGVFHLAGQPGVRGSWGEELCEYAEHNISVDQRMLDATLDACGSRLVFDLSFSVCGAAIRYPTEGADHPAPGNLYGAAKLIGTINHIDPALGLTSLSPILPL